MAAATTNQPCTSVTGLVKQIRRLPEYEVWKRAVFVRDRFTCQHCGKRNGRKRIIEADHIKPLAQLVRECKLISIDEAVDCFPLWNIDNGRCLCHSCHEQTESYPVQFKTKKTKKSKPCQSK